MFETPTPPHEKGPSQEWLMTYLKSISGILKIVEMVMSLIAFICAIVYPYQYHRGVGWTTFVCITGFIFATASFVMHVINVIPEGAVMTILAIVELIAYGVYSLFFFIAFIIAAVLASDRQAHYAAVGAAAFFCFVCVAAWTVDTVVQFMAWFRQRREPTTTSSGGPPTVEATASDTPTY